MEKTKLGLSVAIMSALVFLVAAFGGYTPLLLVAGYILIAEENAQVKKSAVTALIVLLGASVASYVIGFIPNLFDLLFSFLRIFTVDLYFDWLNRIFNFLSDVVYFARSLVLVLLALVALMGKSIKLPFVDKLFD